jgi:hypothetical protein
MGWLQELVEICKSRDTCFGCFEMTGNLNLDSISSLYQFSGVDSEDHVLFSR